jgi:hypothetical protein
LFDEQPHVNANLGLKLDNTFLGEDVRHNFTLASMFVPVASVEYTSSDRDEGVVEARLESTISVGVDNSECVGFSDRNVVGSDSNKRAYQCSRVKEGQQEVGRIWRTILLVHPMHDLRAVAILANKA